jgi:hypothetical protein
VCFRTPETVRGGIERHARQAALAETVPPALREGQAADRG